MSGTLYVVATPLGNLEDITQRALRVLRDVDLVAAEDTRHSGKLLRHFGIATRLTSYYDAVERARAPGLVRELLAGKSVALITDAGTPGIADPGYHLVCAAVEAGISVVPVPGPSAVAAALSVCGLPTDRFVFEGFLPARPAKRRARLEEIAAEQRTIVLYEAPHRARQTLSDLNDIFGPRAAVVMREATKLYESIARGTLEELSARAGEFERGEITIVVAGAAEAAAEVPADLDGEIAALLADGRRAREVADLLAEKYDLPRREAYARVVAAKDRAV